MSKEFGLCLCSTRIGDEQAQRYGFTLPYYILFKLVTDTDIPMTFDTFSVSPLVFLDSYKFDLATLGCRLYSFLKYSSGRQL